MKLLTGTDWHSWGGENFSGGAHDSRAVFGHWPKTPRSALSIEQARRILSLLRDSRALHVLGLVLIEARHEVYVRYHHALIAAVDSCMHVERVLSIDDMLCPLTARWREKDEAVALAHKIKKAIAARVGECMR